MSATDTVLSLWDEDAAAEPRLSLEQKAALPIAINATVPVVTPAKSISDILFERPDVLGAFYREFYDGGAVDRPADWTARFGAATPEAFARDWLDRHGKWEGYASGQEGTVDVERLLIERPDVMASYYTRFYEGGYDKKPGDWVDQVGGTSLNDYAKFWYDRHGKWEGYTQSPDGQTLSAEQILHERPDVLRAFYVEFYEHGAFRKPAEWMAQVGGKSAEDYAKFWYDHHGKWEGYSQRQPEPAPVDLWELEAEAEPEADPLADIQLAGETPSDPDLFV